MRNSKHAQSKKIEKTNKEPVIKEKHKELNNKDESEKSEGSKGIVLKRKPCPIRDNVFPDANKLEKELLMNGTKTDKIDILTLMVERNPSPENFKGLLAFCENQRNDVHYYVLKNIRDILISKKGVNDFYIKQRIVRSFDVNLRNEYIKKKVLRLVVDLLKKDILFIDLLHLFVNKLGDKKDISDYVVDELSELVPKNEETIIDVLEDFYFKNDLFRSRHTFLRFVARLDFKNKKKAFGLFNLILKEFCQSMPEEHKNILLEDIIVGLGKNIHKEQISNVEIVRKAVHTEKMIFYAGKVLISIKDAHTVEFFKDAIKSHKMRNSKRMVGFMNMVHGAILKTKDVGFCAFLLDFCLMYTSEYIVSALLICSEARKFKMKGFDNMYVLRILALHQNDVVRKFALQLIGGEAIHAFDPFDKTSFTSAEMMCLDL
ncbi:hypothetical protein CWI42_020200 [Ordospora colligata]|uniref:Uncharacterized protein n=1 Tax=Ordospora colligata OC4 TaxID=1354746 RepID=A0A0B2UMB2_9MICR|nr:uncharacterized protein M896_020210 [Ordospora colligata OC4]KHN70187.1 hypothetical protein M896_020210 [Ordospora colligata OC4]TBU16731.1 hypothetical protein CWI41_020220 [Ordospora colligata]TBU17037.1 hypothetical protein CWI40_020220 [Ordospora colligata]TBU19461.1 hypothetical protein CWI42_020200 [Ordospora colligata]